MGTNIQNDINAPGEQNNDSKLQGKLSGVMDKVNGLRASNPQLFYGVIIVVVLVVVFLYLKKTDKLPAMGKKKSEKIGGKSKSKTDKKLSVLEEDSDESDQIDELIDDIEQKQRQNIVSASMPE